ncbi:MAG: sigma-70 family RNA polymerase sigma factor [Brumimicrobium sp.]
MNLTKLEDKELVLLYTNGDEKAFEVLLNRHKSRIFNYILSKVKNRNVAQDLFQEVFIKIINTLKSRKYNEEGKFLPWAMRISHNLTIDYFRKNNKVRLISESSSKSEDFTIFNILEVEDKNAEEEMVYKELISQMKELIDHLPDSQRDILIMRIFKDMSFKSIALQEGVSINTALGRMRYALINMRKLIEKYSIVTPISE